VPGPGRYFRLKQQPSVVITRRQFDQHYGSAAAHGTFERKAKRNAGNVQQLLRPARGRTSALKLTPAEQQVEINRRKTVKAETAQQKLANKLRAKTNRNPKSITLRTFKTGTQIRRFRTGIDHEAIESLRAAGERSRIVFGYWVGLELVSERDGEVKTPSLFTQRDIREPFTELDFQKALAAAAQKSYAILTGMWIAMHLKRDAAIRNKARVPQF
jgi:hypothetical protein